ncbi:MAG: B12-binding domain-containing radical SAM protein [bacterium]
MNVYFLIPPSDKKTRVPDRVFGCAYGVYPIPNIFILTFASILRNGGNSVEIIDAPIAGMDTKRFHKYLSTKTDGCFIFYSVNLSTEIDIKTAKMIREQHPAAPIIFCGPAPTHQREKFIFDDRVFVARGEPDWILKELVCYLTGTSDISLNAIKGISYIHRGKIVDNPMRELITNLDELPFPARDLIRRDRYYNPKLKAHPFTIMLTSRGCPYPCSFCVPCSLSFARKIEFQMYNGITRIPPVSFASPAKVIAEFELLKMEGYRGVSIIDDEFLLKPERVKEICKGIMKLGIKWGCLARADHLDDEELIQIMAQAGCRYIDIGIESFNQKILDDLKKQLDASVIPRVVKLLKRYKIEPKLNILVAASPLETEQTIKETINKAFSLKPGLVMFNICTPFPGTELYHRALKNHWFVKKDYYPTDVQKESVIQYPHLKKEVIEKIVIKANRRFFSQPYFILSQLNVFLNLKNLIYSLRSLFRKLSD